MDTRYLDYSEYQSFGGTMDEMPFNILELKIQKKLDARTQERLIGQEIPQEVKLCLFDIIESTLDEIKRKNNQNASSESIDGYSITYLSPSDMEIAINSKSKEIEDIMQTYLLTTKVNDVPILYRGIC